MVYGLNSIAGKKDLSHELIDISESMVEPWCIMGDFNAVYDISHRTNGRLVSTYEMRDFLQVIEDAQLIAAHSVGHWYSWHNKAQGKDRICSRIDHAFVNDQWMDKFDQAVVHHLNQGVSDHTPLVC